MPHHREPGEHRPGVSTSANVETYQDARDLTVDGWVGRETWTALLRDPRICP